jgi:hypothetical protein
VLWVLVRLQQPGDEFAAGHADLLAPFDQALRRPLEMRAVRGGHVEVNGGEVTAPVAAGVRGQLYGIEREVKELSPEDRLRERGTRAVPVAAALRDWLMTYRAKVTEAASLQRDGLDGFAQGLVLRAHHGWVAIGVSAQPHKATGVALAEMVFIHHATRGIPAHLRG